MQVIGTRTTRLVLGLACAASAPAWAQSAVKLSGMLDIGVFRDAAKTWNVGTIQRSNLAFSGTEDLGGGLAATFSLSTRFDLDTGNNEGAGSKPFWHGESTVGLKGGFGAFRAGRALDVASANDWNFDPWYNFDRVASPAWDLWHYNFPSDPQANNGSAEYGRLNNGLFYDSPSFGGVSLHLSGSPEKRDGDARRALAGGLKYAGGPIVAFGSYSKNAAGASDVFLGLKGSVGAWALMGAYNVSKTADEASKAKALTLGVQYFVGAWTFNGGWGRLRLDGETAQKTTSAAVLYALSKRSSVYVDLAHKAYPADSANVYGVGLAHTF